MKVGDLVKSASGILGLVLGRGERGEVFVELTKAINNRTMWAFYEDELKIVGEKNAI